MELSSSMLELNLKLSDIVEFILLRLVKVSEVVLKLNYSTKIITQLI